MKNSPTFIHFTIFAFILLMVLPANGQQNYEPIEVEQSPELWLGNYDYIPVIFGHDDKGYYSFTHDYCPVLEFYDSTFNSIKTTHIDLVDGIYERTLVGFCHFFDTIYLFTREARLRKVSFYVETINKETLEQNRDMRLLLEVPNIKGWEAQFDFKLSRQHEKLLVFSKMNVLNKKFQDVHMLLFGEGLKLEWEAEQRIVYPKMHPRNSIIKVSDEGDAFIMSLLDDQNLASLWDGIRNRYHLLAVTENGKFINTFSLMLPDLYIRGVQIEPGDNHLLVCTGFYSPTHYRGNIDGIFYFELDNHNGLFQNQAIYELDPATLQEATAENLRKIPDELFRFSVDHLIRRNNGDFIMLAENNYPEQYDAYQNILVVSFHPGGAINWRRVIQKRQNRDTYDFNYSSYCVHAPKFSDDIYIAFNENDKNESLAPGKRLKAFSGNNKSNFKVVRLGPEGEMSNFFIYRKTKRRMKTPIPLQYYDKLNNEMVIPAARLNSYKYFNITFN